MTIAQRTPSERAEWRADFGSEISVLLEGAGATRAVAVDPEETIGQVVDRLLMHEEVVDPRRTAFRPPERKRVPDGSRSLVVRLVVRPPA